MNAVDLIRDALARVTRARESIGDGDIEFAMQILDDLAGDLWKVIERQESAG